MKLSKSEIAPRRSFSIWKYNNPFADNYLHSHPELELVFFKKGCGVQFTGNNTRRFEAGDVVLIGAHTSHFWQFDQKYCGFGLVRPAVFVIHFTENFWGKEFLDLPEILPLKTLFKLAKKGLLINGTAKQQVSTIMEKMAAAQECERLIYLLKALATISDSNTFQQFAD